LKEEVIVKAIVFVLTLGLTAAAQAAPFEKGNAAHGRELDQKSCAGCHSGRFGGDGSAVYTRADHKIKDASALAQRISGCNAKTGAGLFPEDEADIGAYLNQTYYHFKK
jgi:mono/diheme cytochrome c family protein